MPGGEGSLRTRKLFVVHNLPMANTVIGVKQSKMVPSKYLSPYIHLIPILTP